MEGLLKTLIRSRNGASSPTRGSGGRSRNKNKDGNSHQFELILEMLARGLVEYAVRKYMPGQGDNHRSSNGGGRHDDRLRTRDHVDDDDQRHRGGVPNVDVEMLEHLGRNILSKAMERFGVSSGEDTEREEAKASGHERGRRKERGYSLDRYTYSRERSRDRSRRRKGEHKDDDHGRRRRHRSRDGEPSHRSGSQRRRGGSPSRRDREEERRRRGGRHRTDYSPLVTELEALSNAIISLNEQQPGHPNCEFYDAFVERSSKVQNAIGGVLGQIREREEKREEMREERRGRRRG